MKRTNSLVTLIVTQGQLAYDKEQTITIISRVQTTKSEIRQIKCRRYAPNGGVPAEVSYVAGSFASISSKRSNTLILHFFLPDLLASLTNFLKVDSP